MPTGCYGTVENAELANAREVDLNAGGLKSVASPSASGNLLNSMQGASGAFRATVGNGEWRRSLAESISRALAYFTMWWNGATLKQRSMAVAGAVGCLLFATVALSGTSDAKPPVAPISSDASPAVAGKQHLEFWQLPCFSGSCDNWMFDSVVSSESAGRKAWDDDSCNRLAHKFGCHDCKSAAASQEYSVFAKAIVPNNGGGRVAVCPSGKPTPGQKATTADGLTFSAVGFLPISESLRMSHLPCWSGSCHNYLLEVGTHSLIADDRVCDFWANTTFGCSNCKRASAVRNDTRLLALSTSLPPGRPKVGRVALCSTNPALGTRKMVSGVGYTVDAGDYWKQ